MTVTCRPWFGKNTMVKTIPFAEFSKTHTYNPAFVCEFYDAASILNLYFDIDIEFDGGKPDLVPVNDRLLAFIRDINRRFGSDECIIVDFSGDRANTKHTYYKYSKHLVFPQLAVDNRILCKLSNADMCHDYFGYEHVDQAVYRKRGMFRQWGLRKPARTKNGTSVVAGPGDCSIYKSGNITPVESGDQQTLRKSLITCVDNEYIKNDITRELESFIMTYQPATIQPATIPPVTIPPVTIQPATIPPATIPPATIPPVTIPPVTIPPVTIPPAIQSELSNNTVIPDEFMRNFRNMGDLSKKYIAACQILFSLPGKYARHDERIKIYSIIRSIELGAGIPVGRLFTVWLDMLRPAEQRSDRDYLAHYQSTPYDQTKAGDFATRLFAIKRKEGLIVFRDEILITNAQTVFLDNTHPPIFKSVTDLYKYILQSAHNDVTARYDDMLVFKAKVFLHMCLAVSAEGDELFVFKTMPSPGHVSYVTIEQKKRCPLNRRMFENKVDGKFVKASFLDLTAQYEALYTRNLEYLGPWVTSQSAVNLSPPAYIDPVKGDNFDKWLIEFKDYFYRVFLGHETNKDELFAYIFNWYSQMVFTDVPTERLLVFTDKVGGLGKSLLFSDIPAYLTNEHYVRLIKGSFGNMVAGFNELARDQKLVVLEESEQYDNSASKSFDTLKEAITSRELQITRKYKATEFVKNTLNYVILTNNPTPILTGLNDRRIMFIELDNPFKTLRERNERAGKFAELMKSNLGNFAWFLLHECANWDNYKNRGLATQALGFQDGLKRAINSSAFIDELVESIDSSLHTDTYGAIIHVKTDHGLINFSMSDIRQLFLGKPGWSVKKLKINLIKEGFVVDNRRKRFKNYLGDDCRGIRYGISYDRLAEKTDIPWDVIT